MPRSALLTLQCLVTAGVLYYLFSVIPAGDIYLALSSASLSYVLLGFLVQVVMRGLAARRIKSITDAHGLVLSTAAIFKTLFVTNFYGLLLPGAVAGGSVTLAKYMQYGAAAGPALLAIVFNRLVETITVTATGISFWVWERGWGGIDKAVFFAPFVTGVLLVCYMIIFGRLGYVSILGRLAQSIRFLRKVRINRKTQTLAETCARVRTLPQSAQLSIFILALAQDLLGAVSMYLFAASLDLGLSFVTIVWIRACVYVLMLLPISLSGLGVREAALVVLCGPYGITAADAMAWSFVIFAGNLFAAAIGGIIEARRLWWAGDATDQKRAGPND